MNIGQLVPQNHTLHIQTSSGRAPRLGLLPQNSRWRSVHRCVPVRAAQGNTGQSGSQPARQATSGSSAEFSRASQPTNSEAGPSGRQDLYDLPGADKITYQLKKSTQALKDVTPDLARDAREKFWGRLAVLIFAAVVVGERITGKGAVQQLELSATNIPIHKMEPLLGGVVILLLLAAFYPGRDKFSGPTLRRRVLKLWAWIQSLSGRLACLGLAGMIVAEVTTGKGALSLLNVETGKQALNEVEAGLAFLVMLFITGDVYKRRDEDWEEED